MIRCMGCMRTISEDHKVCPYCGFITGSEQVDERFLKIGSVIAGRYIIGRALGSGGFGITYIAWDSMTKNTVAIKEYFPSSNVIRVMNSNTLRATDPQSQERFEIGKRKAIEESRCLAALDNIEAVTDVYDCIEENNTAYIVMEYLEGITLKELLNTESRLSFEAAMKIITPVLDSLDNVHKTGLIHRDISPDNIFLCNNGKIKILDFGSARYAMSPDEKTFTIVLKHGFAPVEQYSTHSSQGPWTDVYAVAATLYKMITGNRPVDSIERVNNDTLPSPAQLGINIPPAANNAIMQALTVNEKMRTRTMLSFKKGLLGLEVRQNNFYETAQNARQGNTSYVQPKEESGTSTQKVVLIVLAVILVLAIAVSAAVITSNSGKNKTTVTQESRTYTVPATDAPTTEEPTTEETTTEEPTTEETTTEPVTVSPYAKLSLSENPIYIYRYNGVPIQKTLTLNLNEIPSDGGRILCEIDDESIADVAVVGNVFGQFVENSTRTILVSGKSAGQTTAHFYVENYPDISVDLNVFVLKKDSDDKSE